MYCAECGKTLKKRQKKFCGYKCMNTHNAIILREKKKLLYPHRWKVCPECGENKNMSGYSLIDKTDASKGHRDVCKRCSKNRRERERNEKTWRDDAIGMMLVNSRQRAKRSGLPHTLTRDDIIIPTHCPVLGIELHLENRQGKYAAPSIDRIDNKRGYTPDNIVIVSVRANILKSDATLTEMKALAKFYDTLNENHNIIP